MIEMVGTDINPTSWEELALNREGQWSWEWQKEAIARPDISPDTLRELAKDESEEVRAFIASMPHTPPDVLAELARDETGDIQWMAAGNPSTPPEALTELSQSNDPYMRDYICRALADNPSTPIEVMQQLARDEDEDVRELAAYMLEVRATSKPEPEPEPEAAKLDHRLTPEERKERLATAFNDLNAAVERITTGEDWKKYLDFQSKFHQYSARNCMWLAEQAEQRGMDLEMVASFGAWKKQGRTVNKGEHGLKVLAPIVYNLKKEDMALDPESVERRIKGFKLETVFDVSQTSGPPDTLPNNPMRVAPIVGECDPEILKAIEQEIEKLGYTIKPTNGELAGWPTTTNGNTMPQAHTVQIRDDLSPAATAKTLTHELAHIVMEHDRSNSQSETEAESTAYIVMNHLGIDSGSYSFGYVSGWAQDPSTVQRSAETIRKTAIELTERIDQHLVPRAQQQKDITDIDKSRERSEQNTGIRTLVLDHHDLATVVHAGSFAPVLNRPLPSPDTGPELEIDF